MFALFLLSVIVAAASCAAMIPLSNFLQAKGIGKAERATIGFFSFFSTEALFMLSGLWMCGVMPGDAAAFVFGGMGTTAALLSVVLYGFLSTSSEPI